MRNQLFVQYLPDKTKFEPMRYFFTFCITFLSSVFFTYSANISGSVIDADTGKPMQSVSVFIAGTTFGTTSGVDGTFLLDYVANGSSQLVFAHLGYKTENRNVSEIPLNQPLKVELQIKSQQIPAVSVFAKDSNRKKNMEEFLIGFLGDSEFGKKCTILNPNVIHLVRKPLPGKIGQNQLIAYADSALIIENKLLGYTIRYTLETFSLSKYQISFYGYPLFLDNLDRFRNHEKILENRERAFQGSQMHFFRSLTNKTLQENGFMIFKVGIEGNLGMLSNAYGLMSDSVFVSEPTKHMVQTETPLNLVDETYYLEKSAALQYYQPFEVRYMLNGEDKAYRANWVYHSGMTRSLGQQTTIVKIQGSPLIFYPNGANNHVGDLVTIGYWSFKKVGEILPWDYQPPKTAKQVVTLH